MKIRNLYPPKEEWPSPKVVKEKSAPYGKTKIKTSHINLFVGDVIKSNRGAVKLILEKV